MSSIKFDNTELMTTTYKPRYVKHESIPLRDLTILELAKEDGAIFISERYGVKYITIAGNLKAATQSALETAIDTFKELFSRKEKNLDVSWAGSTRRYVATCIKHNFNRDYLHLTFVPWIAEFAVPSGVGEDISETHAVNNQGFQGAEYSTSVTLGGSAKPKLRVRIKASTTETDPKGISFENTDTGEKIIFTRSSLVGGSYFEFDCRLKTVKYAGVEVGFYGVFPSFKVGSNAYKINVGNIVNQEFSPSVTDGEFNIYKDNGTQLKIAHSFMVPFTDDTFQGVALYLKKLGTPPQPLNWQIETDDGGKPSGTPVTNADGTIASGDVSTSYGWLISNSTNAFTLTANTRYWLVAFQPGGDSSNMYIWRYASGLNATYKKGNAAYSDDNGATYADRPDYDCLFKLLFGGEPKATAWYYFDFYYFKRYL